jgi:predicted transcriptional regulator
VLLAKQFSWRYVTYKLTKEQFDEEIEKGMEDIKAGRVYSADEVEAEMKREFGI